MNNLADQVFGGFDRSSPAFAKVVAGIVNSIVIGFRVNESTRLLVNLLDVARLLQRGPGNLIPNLVVVVWRRRHRKNQSTVRL